MRVQNTYEKFFGAVEILTMMHKKCIHIHSRYLDFNVYL